MKENLNDIQENLLHIHSLASVLFGAYEKYVEIGELPNNEIRNPILSIAEIIMEKSKACLLKAEVIENKLDKHEN